VWTCAGSGFLATDAEALGAINTWTDEVASRIWTDSAQIVDEEHRTHGSKVVDLSLILASLVVEGSTASWTCTLAGVRWTCCFNVLVRDLGKIRWTILWKECRNSSTIKM
jgi:hypothetical protein